MPTPLVVVIAGPNGAGKTTTAPRLLQGALQVRELVNADAIAHGLSAFHPEAVAVAAGRAMLARLKALAAARASFAFETTLATRSFGPWIKGLQDIGYQTHLVFLALSNPAIAIARVAERVRQGGHDVPEAVIRRRFTRGLNNFFDLYADAVMSWQLFENGGLSPRLIASRRPNALPELHDAATWQQLKDASK